MQHWLACIGGQIETLQYAFLAAWIIKWMGAK
jgi:hypothetical protein